MAARRVVVGFDGYLDAFIAPRGPGGERESLGRVAGLFAEAGERGSLAREVGSWTVGAGGNGVNVAAGLCALGDRVDLFATLGDPGEPERVHPAFARVVEACASATSLGVCARTLCFEGTDGKLMLNDSAPLAALDEGLTERALLGERPGSFATRCAEADAIVLCNWAKLVHGSEVWGVLVERVFSGLGHEPWLLVDPADLTQRTAADVAGFAALLGASQRAGCRVVLCCNLAEARGVAGAVGVACVGGDVAELSALSAALRERLGIERVVVHCREGASDHEHGVVGEPVADPVRTTGAGDWFAGAYLHALLGAAANPVERAMGEARRFVLGERGGGP